MRLADGNYYHAHGWLNKHAESHYLQPFTHVPQLAVYIGQMCGHALLGVSYYVMKRDVHSLSRGQCCNYSDIQMRL